MLFRTVAIWAHPPSRLRREKPGDTAPGAAMPSRAPSRPSRAPSREGSAGSGSESLPPGSGTEGGDSSAAESTALICLGCSRSSKDICPIEKKQKGNKATRKIQWGKTTLRKVRGRSGRWKAKKETRKCGGWCRVCLNIAKLEVQLEPYARLEKAQKGAGFQKFKSDLQKKPKVQRRLENTIEKFRDGWWIHRGKPKKN